LLGCAECGRGGVVVEGWGGAGSQAPTWAAPLAATPRLGVRPARPDAATGGFGFFVGAYDRPVLELEDLVTPFLAFADRARASPPPDLAAAWQAEIVEPYRHLFDAITDWVPPERADTVLPGLVRLAASWRDALAVAVAAASEAERILAGAVEVGETIPVTVLVGLGAANGWAAPVDGVPRLFLAVERLPPAPYDVVLALHELVHLLHLRSGARSWPQDRVDATLFSEGLATYVTMSLLPDISTSGHLWWDDDHGLWADRCAELEPTLRKGLLNSLGTTDCRPWFSAAPQPSAELPVRAGYWLGARLIGELARTTSLRDLLDCDLTDATRDLRQLLDD
jgi:hypothetical protein